MSLLWPDKKFFLGVPTFGASLFRHDLGGGDGSVRSELLEETLISDGVVQVLDIQIDALEPEK